MEIECKRHGNRKNRLKSFILYSVLIITGLILYSVLLVLYLRSGIHSDSPCNDGWQPYKEEKCLKIFDTAGLLNYENAERFCKEQNDSYLVSIDEGEKQEFLKIFLRGHSVVDNVWIGLKYVKDAFKWTDGTGFHYTNWAHGSPKKNTSYCFQIQTEAANFGLWSDEWCWKKNLVVCERVQHWSLTQLQTNLVNTMKNLVQQRSVSDAQFSSLTNTIRNQILPVGFIYVQLPNEKPPAEIWPWMEWEDVSSKYAGLFFRTQGGNAAPFGEIQNADSPRLISLKEDFAVGREFNEINVLPNNEYSQVLDIDEPQASSPWGFRVKVSDGEVRPVNMAIRIWKRTK